MIETPQCVLDVWQPSRPGMRAMMHWRDSFPGWDGWGHRIVSMLGTPLRGPVLEWGPGGGAALCVARDLGYRGEWYGVDICDGSHEQCAQWGDYHPRRPEDGAMRGVKATTLVSTACFWHFPDQRYGERVLACMRASAAQGCAGVVQIKHEGRLDGAYADTYTDATTWDVVEFWRLLESTGFRPLDVAIDGATAWYRFTG